ncbi:MAG: site-specific DNA-methyltransferase [Betaproteobacteria bacterium]|nr:site-specific DNA-methyltransferase [Betaproteobacteria bacterium]
MDEGDLLDRPRKAELFSEVITISGCPVRRVVGEFWTAGQRQASSIHEVSYRACFKPQLPAYFIKRFTSISDIVYDPFSGRGTTIIEAALQGRRVIANDINPLSAILARPRLAIPEFADIADRIKTIPYRTNLRADIDLSMFYELATESEIVSLRSYLKSRRDAGLEDQVDSWIRMIATNRLTGHSPGFFSVYTFPPNQAVSAASQIKINRQRGQKPEYRNTKAIMLKKTRQLLAGLTARELENLRIAAKSAIFLTGSATKTDAIPNEAVSLTVTSPPFLDIVQYAEDNWLRCWFNDLPTEEIASQITMAKTLEAWCETMGRVYYELFRITRGGGFVAFEVGEVRKGRVKLEEHVIPLGLRAGFNSEAVLINDQKFTKTANIWGISNNKAGTNSNRIVVFRKPV